MRCNEAQERLVEGSTDAPVGEHLAGCAECRSFAGSVESLQTGFKLLAQEATPEPSIGFAARVLRHLEESPKFVFEPLEVIGRRAVFAAGAVAMTIMMALALSSSGPIRGTGSAFSMVQGDSSETVETFLAGGVEENEEMSVLPLSVNGAESR